MYYAAVPLELVEKETIDVYRLRLFSILNNSALQSGLREFKYMTDDEEIAELDDQIEFYKKKGFFNGQNS